MYKILIKDQDRTAWIPRETIDYEDSVGVKQDSLSFEMEIKNFEVNPPEGGNVIEIRLYWESKEELWQYVPRVYTMQEVDYDDSEGMWFTREFAGIIQTVAKRWVSPPHWINYSVSCCDWTRFFDRLLVNKTYVAGMYAGEIVADLIGSFTQGFTANNVQMGYKVPEFVFDFQEPSACIDELAESIGFQWYIDATKDIHFYWIEDRPSPLIVDRDNIYDVEAEMELCTDLEITFDASNVKNRLVVKNPNFKGAYVNEDFVGAQTKFYNALYGVFPFSEDDSQEKRQTYVKVQIWTLDENGEINETVQPITFDKILLDDIEGTAGDGQGDAYTIYVNFEKGFRLPDNFTLQKNQILRIWYYKTEGMPVIEQSLPSIIEMAAREGTSGVYEYAHDASGIYTEKGEELTVVADRVLSRDAFELKTGTFVSQRNGWMAGQHFKFYSYRFGEPGEILDETMFITGVSKRLLTADLIESTISFSSIPSGM